MNHHSMNHSHAKHRPAEHDMSQMNHGDHEQAMVDPRMAAFMEKDMRNRFLWSLLFSIPVFLYSPVFTEFLGIELPTPIPHNWLLFLLTTPVVFKFGSIFSIGAYQALKNKTLNMMVLIATGVFAAYLFSVFITVFVGGETFFEAAALLVTFVLFGHWMEMKSRKGTSEALRALFDLVPPQARVIRNGKEIIVPTSEVKINDILLLKPGDKVPVDGQVLEGKTSVDESLVTGESLPVFKKAGDQVIGGSINQSGSVKFKATKIGMDTVLAQIVKMVETAQNSKAPGQRIADRAAQYLVILAIGAGLLTFIVWFFIAGEGLLLALTFAVSAIVIACPDALGLATPTAVAVGTGLGAKHNILIKDATTLEQTSKIQTVVLDKTGTLTEGKPKITDVVAVKGFSANTVLRLTAAVEAKSAHPLSKAVLEEAKRRKLTLQSVDKFSSIAGHGVEAVVGGQHILVGAIKLMQDRKVNLDSVQKDVERLLREGKTLMILAVDGKVRGVAAAADTVKKSAFVAIKRMEELGLEVVMVTGDNKKTAEVIGKKLGIDRVFAEVLPEDKAEYIKQLQSEGKFVAMVGDGVNDAPALAQADIGIAIGAGTDVAIETADIVLMKSDPVDILRAIRLSKATVRKMKQNLVWASVYNILAIPVAAGVFYPSYGITLRPEVSALLMSASSIIVAVNAVSLKRVEKDLLITN
ncbi:MAG: copper-translocating P-type ATPase [Candidatus Daviesbacteria bacterium]|nr:copper-translocating P-type ATPase [Candidatus Daviesbacteria bacterium]